MSATPVPVSIGFILYPDLTQLDLTGPFEVLSRLPSARLHLIARSFDPVKASGGPLSILPTTDFGQCPPIDILCVPGGPGHLSAMLDDQLLAFLHERAPACRYVTAVCTGSLILAAAGLLRGYRATTHWLSLGRLRRFGAEPIGDRVVFDRDRVTGGGVTAGIDFALRFVAELAGDTFARDIQLQIEYAPEPPFEGAPWADPVRAGAIRSRLHAYVRQMEEVDQRAASQLETLKPPLSR